MARATRRTGRTARGRGAGARPGYHHGALRAALLAAAEAILAERGVDGFTLREAARRAGVSPAAPAHHFGSAAGLLAAVAALGFRGLGAAMRAAIADAGDDPLARLRAAGEGYVRYALAEPARFRLMFRRERIDGADPAFREAARAAYLDLEGAIRAVAGIASDAPLDDAAYARLLGAWSIVHGFAHLALEGQLDRFAAGRSAAEFAAATLPAVLERTVRRD